MLAKFVKLRIRGSTYQYLLGSRVVAEVEWKGEKLIRRSIGSPITVEENIRFAPCTTLRCLTRITLSCNGLVALIKSHVRTLRVRLNSNISDKETHCYLFGHQSASCLNPQHGRSV
jgi:hypothetical protein